MEENIENFPSNNSRHLKISQAFFHRLAHEKKILKQLAINKNEIKKIVSREREDYFVIFLT
jgi:hypothetical protein